MRMPFARRNDVNALGVVDASDRPGDHDLAETGNNPGNPLIVALNKPLRHRPSQFGYAGHYYSATCLVPAPPG